MFLLKQETIQGETISIYEEGLKMFAVLTDENNNLLECYTRSVLDYHYYTSSDDEKALLKQSLNITRLSGLYDDLFFQNAGMNAVQTFSLLKEMSEISTELYERTFIFVEEELKQGKKNNLSNELTYFFEEMKFKNKLTLRMMPFEYDLLTSHIQSQILEMFEV